MLDEILRIGSETLGMTAGQLAVTGGAAASAASLISLTVAYANSSKSHLKRVLKIASIPANKNAKPEDEDDMDGKGPLRVNKAVIKVGVDKRFYKQFRYILRIAIPNWKHKTIFIIMLHTAFLVLRTYLSVVVARIDGLIARDLIAADGKAFARSIGYWFMISLPATYTNSMIKYLQSKLAINLRTSLTNYVHDLYMKKRTYYKASNLDNRIDGADQLITSDINRFCNALASLYSNLGKPILDLIIFNYQLGRSIGFTGMVGLSLNYMITATLMRAVTPSFGKMAAIEAQLEGDFRTAHSRLITNAEEIGFYHGGDLEKSILNRTYLKLIKHINGIYNIRIAYNMFEDMIIKYSWSAVGLLISSIPVFYPEYAGSRTKREAAAIAEEDSIGGPVPEGGVDRKTGSRTQGFITNKRLMLSLADAGGRIMYSYKELSELAGYTYRVYNMLRVLQDLHDDKYVQTGENKDFSLENIQGTITYGYTGIKFDHVPVVTPNGDSILVRDLSFNISPGDHLMITGPNGAGKTSVVRLLSGLWPMFKGNISRPQDSLKEIIYIPQRPYLAIGTLRDQIIYPHSVDEMRAAGKTDEDLMAILKDVYLDYIPAREGGFDAVKEWKDGLSGGEKQRVQLARLFYHSPRFAVLDEATSAVSNDVEALLYTNCKDAGITVITISHRPTLFKYHQYLLRIGDGAEGDEWSFEQIGGSHAFLDSVEAEIKKIEKQLETTEGMKRRLQEINKELKLDVAIGGQAKEGDLKNAKRTLV
ncbi:hypothetical protein HDV05_007352 [Chytridiales sp. JEL 0842]|nr:hypothetical protein HDV05_007352 [Chytridiales sp. JEL 0842]